MSGVADVFAGLKTIAESNGYSVVNSVDVLPGQCMIYQTQVEPVYEENASRHIGIFDLILSDTVKPNQKLVSESAAAVRVETLIKALKDGFSTFAVVLEINGAATAVNDAGNRQTVMTITAQYAV